MNTIVNPQQARLFDPFEPVLTEQTRHAQVSGAPAA
jgi:hypothetical protein